MATVVMGTVLVILVAGFVVFYRYSRTEAWWESGTRKALLHGMIALAPFLGMRYRNPHHEPPTISVPAEPGTPDDRSSE